MATRVLGFRISFCSYHWPAFDPPALCGVEASPHACVAVSVCAAAVVLFLVVVAAVALAVVAVIVSC